MHASETNRSLTTSLNSHKSTTFVSPLFLHRETKSRDEHSSDLFHLQLKSDWQFWLAKMIRTRHITTIWSFEYVLDIGYNSPQVQTSTDRFGALQATKVLSTAELDAS